MRKRMEARRARGARALRCRSRHLHRRPFLHPAVGLSLADACAQSRPAAARAGDQGDQFLRRLRTVRRGRARGGALPVLLSRFDHRQSDSAGTASSEKARSRDRLACSGAWNGASRAPDTSNGRVTRHHKSQDRSRSQLSPWAAKAAAFLPTGSSTSRSTAAISRKRPRCPASRSAPAQRSITSSSFRKRPRSRRPRAGAGLMPMPGDVDVVLASELMEAARAVERGFVTPDTRRCYHVHAPCLSR